MTKFNILQQPKSKGYLECITAADGWKLVQLDLEALEPKILAYYSRDTNLMRLYGPGAKPNDVYLYVAAMMGDLGAKIRATGYDPLNPTKESISKAKKECKIDRNVAKKFHLSCSYGASPKKLCSDLSLTDTPIPLSMCEQYHKDYWKLFKDVKVFEKTLLDQYSRNGGYIINGSGRPLSRDPKKTKDIVNLFIQSTGGDVMMKLIQLIYTELKRNSVTFMPFIAHFYDESIMTVPEDQVDLAKQSFEEALRQLNEFLGFDVKMSGSVVICDNLAQIKVEE